MDVYQPIENNKEVWSPMIHHLESIKYFSETLDDLRFRCERCVRHRPRYSLRVVQPRCQRSQGDLSMSFQFLRRLFQQKSKCWSYNRFFMMYVNPYPPLVLFYTRHRQTQLWQTSQLTYVYLDGVCSGQKQERGHSEYIPCFMVHLYQYQNQA